jgi:hypothetical protein
MMIVQADREIVADHSVLLDRGFEDQFLHVARQIRPQPERGASEQPFIFLDPLTHVLPLILPLR